MPDPAVDAARRVWVDYCANGAPDPEPGSPGLNNDLMTAAAREMAKSIQELHHEIMDDTNDVINYICAECFTSWPCKTAERVYTTEQLGDIGS